jgi:hypothetical protein
MDGGPQGEESDHDPGAAGEQEPPRDEIDHAYDMPQEQPVEAANV